MSLKSDHKPDQVGSKEIVLTPDEVEQIRKEARARGTNTFQKVASKWNIDVGHVTFISRREAK